MYLQYVCRCHRMSILVTEIYVDCCCAINSKRFTTIALSFNELQLFTSKLAPFKSFVVTNPSGLCTQIQVLRFYL
jgi:hypothetical protein